MKNQKGVTLVELMLSIALVSTLSISAFSHKAAEFEQNKAKEVGTKLLTYNSAVQQWVSKNPDAVSQGNALNVSKLKAQGFLPDNFPDTIKFGDIELNTDVKVTGGKVEAVTKTVDPFTVGGKVRPELAAMATLMAAAGMGSIDVPSYLTTNATYKSYPVETEEYPAGTIIMTASNTPANDVWLRSDGSNTMDNVMTFNPDIGASFRGISNLAKISSLGGEKLVVDADTEILGQLIAKKEIIAESTIKATGNITGNAFHGKVFYDSDNTAFHIDPASTTNLNIINANTVSAVTFNSQHSNMDFVNSDHINTNTMQVVNDMTAGSVTSSGRLVAGEYLQINKVETEGLSCTQNGLIARDTIGKTLSCQAGVWRAPVGPGAKAWVTFRGRDAECPAGNCTILVSNNVESVKRLSKGHYMVNIAAGVLSSNYYSYSAFGSDAEVSGTNGSAARYSNSVRTSTQFEVLQFGGNWDTKLDTGEMSVIFYQ